MGSDKAMVHIQGGPLWSRQLNLLGKLGQQQRWISARIAPAWCPQGVEIVLDSPPACGPVSGIRACLDRLSTTHLVVLGIDMPRMNLEHLRKLMSFASPGRSVIPKNGDYFEPLCAVYAQSAAPFALAAVAAADCSLQRLVQQLVGKGLATPYPLSIVERPLYLNLNTPQDLKAL